MNGKMVGGVLAIVGAILLLAAIWVPWYTYSYSQSTGSVNLDITTNLLPGSSFQGTSTCSGNSTICALAGSVSITQSYAGHANNTGNLYMAVEYLLLGGGILALLGAILGMVAMRGKESWMKPAMILVILGLVLGLAAGAYVAADNTSALKADYTSTSTNVSGPWSSFIGSCSGGATCPTSASGTASWGPAIGFYLCWVGVALLLVAVLMAWMGRKSMGMAAPAPPAPAPTETPPAGPGGMQ